MDVGELPNIGDVLAERLRKVGITTDAQLKKVGDAEAFLRHPGRPARGCLHPHKAGAGRCGSRRAVAFA